MTSDFFGVILAGGKGERLWPLSRERLPKQLLLLHQKSLVAHTFDRLTTVIPFQNCAVITIAEQAENISTALHDQCPIIIEPHARNTAPALLLSCLQIAQKNPDAIILFSPADHYINELSKFSDMMQQALIQGAHQDSIILIGIKPTTPATGYGYIEYKPSDGACSEIVRFHEKPSLEQAQRYCKENNMLWNIGIFCAKASVFIEEYKRLAPEIFVGVHDYFVTGDQDSYQNLPSISIDYAIMEKSSHLSVIPADFAWSDVGNLATFLSLHTLHARQQKQINLDAHNNLVMTEGKLAVLIGVDDLCVVQTDDVLLIAKRDDVEKVKMAVSELKKNHLAGYL